MTRQVSTRTYYIVLGIHWYEARLRPAPALFRTRQQSRPYEHVKPLDLAKAQSSAVLDLRLSVRSEWKALSVAGLESRPVRRVQIGEEGPRWCDPKLCMVPGARLARSNKQLEARLRVTGCPASNKDAGT